jgi:hypothetical protein
MDDPQMFGTIGCVALFIMLLQLVFDTKVNIHLLDFDGQFANSTKKIDPYLPIAIFATSFLHVHCLSIASRFLSSNLSHWVKRTSTTLFSCFIKTKYDDERWVEIF